MSALDNLQIKLLLIGDSGKSEKQSVETENSFIFAGVGKSCLLLRFADDSFTPTFITTIGYASSCRKRFPSAPTSAQNIRDFRFSWKSASFIRMAFFTPFGQTFWLKAKTWAWVREHFQFLKPNRKLQIRKTFFSRHDKCDLKRWNCCLYISVLLCKSTWSRPQLKSRISCQC